MKCDKTKSLQQSKTAHTKKHTHKKNCVDKNWQQNLYKKGKHRQPLRAENEKKTNKQTKMQFQGKSSNTESGNLTWLDYIDGWKAISVTTIIDSNKQFLVSEFEGSGYFCSQHWAYYHKIIFHLRILKKSLCPVSLKQILSGPSILYLR